MGDYSIPDAWRLTNRRYMGWSKAILRLDSREKSGSCCQSNILPIEPRNPACEEFTSRQAGWVGVIKHLQEHTGLYSANRSLSKLIHQRLTQKFFPVVVG